MSDLKMTLNNVNEELEGGDGTMVFFETSEVPKGKIKVTKDLNFVTKRKINRYLKRKGYHEVLVPKTISKEDLAQMINPELSKVNSVLYGASYRADEIVEEIERFYKFFLWVKSRMPNVGGELKPMLMPMLVLLVRESYANGFKPISSRLVGEFHRKFLLEDKTEENCVIGIAMAMLKNGLGFEQKFLKMVCQKRHKFMLSDAAFSVLKKFLSKLKRSLLINIICNQFIIELKTSQEISEAFNSSTNDDTPAKVQTPATSTCRARKILDRLRGSVTANLPSIKIYTTNARPTCAASSREGTMFAFGMSPAGIRICDATSAKDLPPDNSVDESDPGEDDASDSDYNPEIRTVGGHEGSVYGVAFHPRVKLLYSVGQDAIMRTWGFEDDGTVGCRAIYRGHLGPIWSLDITSSGHFLATASMDSTARIWAPERIDCVRILAGHYSSVNSIKFHPNESYLATGSIDKSVRLWSVTDGELVRILTGMGGKTNSLSFHQSGNYLIGGGCGDMLCVWDMRQGELLAELPSANNCRDVSFCGNMLAGCFRTGTVQMWNLRNYVGGCDSPEGLSGLSVPTPFTMQCNVHDLVSLYYKDVGTLYCMGSDPSTLEDIEDDEQLLNLEDAQIFSDLEPESDTLLIPENFQDHVDISEITDELFTEETDNQDQDTTEEENTQATSNSSMSVDLLTSTSTVLEEDIMNSMIPSSDDLVPVDLEASMEDGEAENTNNTITSSDMEFEVSEIDEHILASFVDDQNVLEPS